MDMAKQELDKLTQSYFRTFTVRVEVLPEYLKRKSYSDVIRESQEALELFLKALLRSMGWSPSFSHDPGQELSELKKNIPVEFKEIEDGLIEWSKKLRRERELSYYGAQDFIPSEEYSEKEAKEALLFLEEVSKRLKKYLQK
jgi:HEPN domain-containing protein